jgi:hypothetical protein
MCRISDSYLHNGMKETVRHDVKNYEQEIPGSHRIGTIGMPQVYVKNYKQKKILKFQDLSGQYRRWVPKLGMTCGIKSVKSKIRMSKLLNIKTLRRAKKNRLQKPVG